MNDETFLTILRYGLGLVGVWIIWLVVRSIKGAAAQPKPNDAEPEESGHQAKKTDQE